MFDTFLPALHAQLRTRNALPPLVSLLIGYSFTSPGSYENPSLYICTASIVLLMFYATLQNDLADIEIDAKAGRKSPLVQKQLDSRTVGSWAYAFLAGGLAVGLVTWNPIIIVGALAYAGLIWAYNRGPLRGSHRPILSIILLALLLGGLPFLLGVYIASGTLWLSILPLLAGICSYRFSISILKDYKDFDEDKAFGKQTFLIRYGARNVRRASIVCALAGYVLIVSCLVLRTHNLSGWVVVIGLVLLAAAGIHKRLQLGESKDSFKPNNVVFQDIFNTALYFDLGVALCLYIS